MTISDNLKPFKFNPITRRGFAINTYHENDWTNILYEGEIVGVIFEESVTPEGLAPFRVALSIQSNYSVNVTHILKNRFKSIEDAQEWCLLKQVAIFDQFVLSHL